MSDFQAMITKLLPPQAGTNLLERPRLLNLVSQTTGWQVALVTAPAGYGKSIFMTQLVQTIPKPLVWYQLDDYDNDPAIFIHYIIAGVQRHFPGFGEKIIPMVQQGDPVNRLRLLVTIIINELAGIESGLVLALDDFHLIIEPVIHRFIQEFLSYLPEKIQFIIASRNKIPYSLPRPSLKGKLVSIETQALRFTGPEITAFVIRHYPPISEKECGILETKTNGWPAIFRFMNPAVLKAVTSGDNIEIATIYEYLASEVLDRQPEEIRSFLLKSSVLEVMTPPSCDLLLERNDSEQILKYLENQQLFLTQLTGTGQAYRYHQLFRDFLTNRLGSERTGLLQRAGNLARQMGALDRAVECFLIAGCEAELDSVLPEACRRMFQQGRWQTATRWLDALSITKIETDPWLALFKGQVEVYRGRLEQAATWTERAVTGFTEARHDRGLQESQILQAHICRCRGQYFVALGILEDLELILTPEELKQRFDLPLEKSLCLFMAGRFDTALTFLQKTLSTVEEENNPNLAAHLLETLGNVEYFLGNYVKALQYYKRGAAISPEQILPSYYMQDSISTIYQDWGQFEQAFEYAKRSVAIKENYGLTEALPSAYLQLASIYVDRNELKRAEEYYQRAINILRENNGERFYLILNLVFLSRCLSMQGRWVEARAKAEEALQEAYLQPGLALAVCQVVGASVFIENGEPAKGLGMLCEAVTELEQMGFLKVLCFGYLHLAWYYFNMADLAKAGENVVKGLKIASRLNYLQIFITYYEMMQPILIFGLENDLEVTFIQRILVQLGERSFKIFAEMALKEEPQIRTRIIPPLVEIGGAKTANLISALLDDENIEVRRIARLAAEKLNLETALNPRLDKGIVPIDLKTLGPFKLVMKEPGCHAVKWRTLRTRDLLAYLVHCGGAVSKDRILEDLWPDTDFKHASNLFHTTLGYLRLFLNRVGQPDLILYQNKQYQIATELLRSDRQKFQMLLTKGIQTDLNQGKAAVYLEEAVTLYHGDYLEELDYTWLIPEREHLKRLYSEARLRLANYYLEKPAYDQAISHLKILAQLNPLDEEVHRLLMTGYVGAGKLTAAMEQYHSMTKMLHEELGLTPAPETIELFRQILKGRNPRSNYGS